MKILMKKLIRQENMGVIDRSVRVLAGFLLTLPLLFMASTDFSPVLMDGLRYGIGVALYVLATGMLGWDPLYALFHAKTCGTSSRHLCGSYPHQLRALFGRQANKDPGYRTHALKPGERVTGSGSSGNWL